MKLIVALGLMVFLWIFPNQFLLAQTKVYVIISKECPICQYMGKDLEKINNTYGEQAELFLVFPFKNSNIKKASLYKSQFGLSNFKILMDVDQNISRKLGATVTPEAIVMINNEEVIYRGRVNDGYQIAGRKKHNPSKRDLNEAIWNSLNSKPIAKPWPAAVGCYVTYQKQHSK